MTDQDPRKGRCPDGCYCHGATLVAGSEPCAPGKCLRVRISGPLSGVFPGDCWPREVLMANPPSGVEPFTAAMAEAEGLGAMSQWIQGWTEWQDGHPQRRIRVEDEQEGYLDIKVEGAPYENEADRFFRLELKATEIDGEGQPVPPEIGFGEPGAYEEFAHGAISSLGQRLQAAIEIAEAALDLAETGQDPLALRTSKGSVVEQEAAALHEKLDKVRQGEQ